MEYERKLQQRVYGKDVKQERSIERSRLARERMEWMQRAGKADPEAIAEMLDPKIGGLPDAIPQQECYKERNPPAAGALRGAAELRIPIPHRA